ncbi:MAG TPA: peroxiredoxin [Victivallales bacterium]|nr:peroxiredoxin [Victivallales bacterium]
MLKIGDKAVQFELKNQRNETVNLKNYCGKWVVLYFYPRDNTPGCTKEACDFTDSINDFADLSAEIIGISPDSPESHVKFINKYDLKVQLLCDITKEVMKDYGAWGEKNMYGKITECVIRSTFIIDPEGKVAASWSKVKVRVKRKSGEVRHSDIVREKLLELQK